jgi:gluconate 2-dehydrogenase alpha chain
LQRALLTGRALLRPETFVSKLIIRNGLATGVEYREPDGSTKTETARHIVIAAGAIETPRLLLLSGLEHPLIGRHLMVHFQTLVMAGLRHRVHPHRGRSVTHVHDDHLVPDARSQQAASAAGLGWFRGGMVEHCGPSTPIQEAKLYPWGAAHTRSMKESALRDRMWGFTMQGEDMPQPTNGVDLDPKIRDVRGFPVARVTYSSHPFELAASDHYAERLTEILESMDAEWTVTTTSPAASFPYGGFISPVPQSKHVMGTTRMGTDPATSVVDPVGRLHDVPNVVIADSSVFVTSSGYGPTLTLVALALRASRALLQS